MEPSSVQDFYNADTLLILVRVNLIFCLVRFQIIMSRNILELKSISVPKGFIIPPDSVKQSEQLKGFDLRLDYFETVYSPKDLIEKLQFYKRKGVQYEDMVAVSSIKGTTHEGYYGGNWLSMMMNLQRNKYDFDVSRVKAAIINASGERIYLSKYGDHYFIDGGGNHRVCQARFLDIHKIPCFVTEYVLDEGAYELSKRLSQIDSQFKYKPEFTNNSCFPITYKGVIIIIRFKNQEISMLERIISRAEKTSYNTIASLICKVHSFFDSDDNYVLSQSECHNPSHGGYQGK